MTKWRDIFQAGAQGMHRYRVGRDSQAVWGAGAQRAGWKEMGDRQVLPSGALPPPSLWRFWSTTEGLSPGE